MEAKLNLWQLLSLLMLTLTHFTFAQTFIVDDDFESETLGTLPTGWEIRYHGSGPEDQIVVDSPVKNGIHSFQVSGTGWAANLSKSITEIPDKVILEGWMYAENVESGGRCGLGIGSPTTGSWGAYAARVEFYNGNLITYHYTGNSGGYGTQYVLQTATSNSWYHVKIETDTSAGIYRVYVNGVQASSTTTGTPTTEFPLLTSITQTSVEIYGNSMIYFDDIRLYGQPNQIAYYPFNGNANDESGNNLHGTVSGATLTMDRFDNPDSAYSFDANDIITIPHDDILNVEDQLSISLWVNPTTQQNALILGKSNYTTATNYLLRTKTNGFIQFEYKEFADSNTEPLVPNAWNHIAVVSNANNLKQVYINGVLASHTTNDSPFGINSNSLTIGARPGAEHFNGSIDDIRIYKTALTQYQVQELYNNNTLSIDDVVQIENIDMYVYDKILHFKTTQFVERISDLHIYNMIGQRVYQSSDINQETVLNFLDRGIYILKIQLKNGAVADKKFLIQ